MSYKKNAEKQASEAEDAEKLVISSELKAALRYVFGEAVNDKYKGIRLI